jgi:hypothetical protein
MAVQLTVNGMWLWGDAPPTNSGNRSAIVAATVCAVNEEVTSTNPTRYTTFVRTIDGVTTFFEGRVGADILGLIPNPIPSG